MAATNVPSETPIEADAASPIDSAVGDDLSSHTVSLASSVLKYPVENGRRYHAYKAGQYPFPCDEKELDRMDMTHHMCKLGIGALHLSPIGPNPQRIGDIGTGSGIWAIEMGLADQYPSAEVIGTDLSPIQPTIVPPNVKFIVDDAEEPWVFQEPFDFLYFRFLGGGFRDFPQLMRRALENLKPGGWVEFHDIDARYYSDDGTYSPQSETGRWLDGFMQAGERSGRDVSPGQKLDGWVREAGFTNVIHRSFKMPVGPWPKDAYLRDCGRWNLMQTLEGLEGFTLRLFTTTLNWSVEEVQVLLAMVRKELKQQTMHAIWDFHVVCGQRPEPGMET